MNSYSSFIFQGLISYISSLRHLDLVGFKTTISCATYFVLVFQNVHHKLRSVSGIWPIFHDGKFHLHKGMPIPLISNGRCRGVAEMTSWLWRSCLRSEDSQAGDNGEVRLVTPLCWPVTQLSSDLIMPSQQDYNKIRK